MPSEHPAQRRNIDVEAMAIIKSSAILNPDATLDMIMATVNRLAELEPAGPKAAEGEVDTFFGPWFCYSHSTVPDRKLTA